MILRKNQKLALQKSMHEDFQSGTHAHATGTGKSVIGLTIIEAFVARSSSRTPTVLWLCEQASVIKDIFKSHHRCVVDLVNHKPKDWAAQVNSARIWKRPIVVVANRAFLVSQERYRALSARFDLVIHDECHSGTGKTTVTFYEWLLRYPGVRVIGLSATPPSSEKAPHTCLARIITRYSIYSAVVDGVILAPVLAWAPKLEHQNNPSALVNIILNAANHSCAHKIIVWAGTIAHTIEMATAWLDKISSDAHLLSAFGDVCAVDTSVVTSEFVGYKEFRCAPRGIMFCAAKHREGSDIPGLEMAVFVDGVTNRSATTFVQCVGRVLRPNGDNKYGVILDLCARNGLDLCEKVGEYLGIPPGRLPWSFDSCDSINYLTMVRDVIPSLVQDSPKTQRCLASLFTRKCPQIRAYTSRVEHELDVIRNKGVGRALRRALEVLNLAGDIPHVTRGSSGSSLVCYLLGISHVDPVKYNISFARFLSSAKNTLPDVDFDFPHSDRGDVFLRIASRWPGKVARISNHVRYHEKSATREALRSLGHPASLNVAEQYQYISSLSQREAALLRAKKKELCGKFRNYSLHCGGIVYYPDGVPDNETIASRSRCVVQQVRLDKRDVSSNGFFKIDVLSSRALSQIKTAIASIPGVELNIAEPPITSKVIELLSKGDTIGVTLGESALCRTEFATHKPTTVVGVAECIASIRPAARASSLIFDDDVIQKLSSELNVSSDEADRLRRLLKKDYKAAKNEIITIIGEEKGNVILEEVRSFGLYSFCKAHAVSYAQVVLWLVWLKAHHPKEFWVSTLKNCDSSYAKWVHLWEASKAGVPSDGTNAYKQRSVYASQRLPSSGATWNMLEGFHPACSYTHGRVTGLLAASRSVSATHWAVTLGLSDRYLDLLCSKEDFPELNFIVSGVVQGKELVRA